MYQTFKQEGDREKENPWSISIINNVRVPYTHRKTRDFNLPREGGMVPEMLLLYKSKLIRLFKLPSSLGIVPWMLFL